MEDFTLNEVWKYAFSNFNDNRNRAALAEFIVAKALGITESPNTSWENYDITTESGIKVEVKSSAYIQEWNQRQNTIPTFEIKKKQGWNGNGSEYDGIYDRHADVYVFCLEHECNLPEGVKPNPLNPDHWTFWIVPTSLINEHLTNQKTVRISTLEKVLGIKSASFEEISSQVEVIGQNL